MKTKNIKITNLDDLNAFVTMATTIPGSVAVSRGKFCVDGKSILGMMFINTSEGCKVEYPESTVVFEEFLAKFEN